MADAASGPTQKNSPTKKAELLASALLGLVADSVDGDPDREQNRTILGSLEDAGLAATRPQLLNPPSS